MNDELRRLNEVAREDFGLTQGQLRVLVALFALRECEGEHAYARARAIVDVLVAVDGEAPSVTTDLPHLLRWHLVERDTSQGPPFAWRITRLGIDRLRSGGVQITREAS